MRRTVIFAFTLGAFMMPKGRAQAAPDAVPLTLGQAQRMALREHPQIAVAQNTASAAGQGVIEAQSAYYPVVKGEVTGQQALMGSRFGAEDLSTSLLFDKFSPGLELDQLVTDFGRRSNLTANARLNAKAAEENTHAASNDVLVGVTRAYFAALQAGAYVRVAEETVKARQSVANQVGALATAQLKSQIDFSFANVNVSQAKLLLIRAQAGLQQSYADLSRALGQDHPTRFALQDIDAPITLPSDDAALVNTAIENRPELRELRLRVEAAQKFEAAERDLKRPNVTAVAVGGALPYLNQEPRVTPREYEGVALTLEIPIFNGHLFSARAEAARFQTAASDQRLRDLRQQIEHDVRVTWLVASNASQRIPVTEELVKQANFSLELAQGRYNLGLASIVEITQAQLAVTQAQIENAGARYEYESAYAGLQYTLGTLR